MLEELQNIIDTQILPAQNMGFKLARYDGTVLKATAPLAANTNHHSTAFGGSQYSLAAVAGWAILRCKLSESGLQGAIVVKSASMDYLRPVSSESFSINVQLTAPDELSASMLHLTETGSANFGILGIIYQNNKEAARYKGTYSIKKSKA